MPLQIDGVEVSNLYIDGTKVDALSIDGVEVISAGRKGVFTGFTRPDISSGVILEGNNEAALTLGLSVLPVDIYSTGEDVSITHRQVILSTTQTMPLYTSLSVYTNVSYITDYFCSYTLVSYYDAASDMRGLKLISEDFSEAGLNSVMWDFLIPKTYHPLIKVSTSNQFIYNDTVLKSVTAPFKGGYMGWQTIYRPVDYYYTYVAQYNELVGLDYALAVDSLGIDNKFSFDGNNYITVT